MKKSARILSSVTALALALAPAAISQNDAAKTIYYIKGPRPDAPLPLPGGMPLLSGRVALVIADPQNDFLHPKGVAWGVVGQSVTENRTVENLESLFKAAKANGVPVFISPHYYFQHDCDWKFEGALERVMHSIKMFDRKGALTTEGFSGSGADWLKRYKPYMNDGKTVVTSPHSSTTECLLPMCGAPARRLNGSMECEKPRNERSF